MCGEQWRLWVDWFTHAGSSPRVRGTGYTSPNRPFKLRFIPACAGNRRQSMARIGKSWVHPRVCGEQMTCCPILGKFLGSSPRVRGTAFLPGKTVRRLRFIPACAGNRTVITRVAWPVAVHPRVCGEQLFWQQVLRGSSGSSPRVRGTVVLVVFNLGFSRFIPACAGNSTAFRVNTVLQAVHPRVCGEQLGASSRSLLCAGSSPRVRGTVRRVV